MSAVNELVEMVEFGKIMDGMDETDIAIMEASLKMASKLQFSLEQKFDGSGVSKSIVDLCTDWHLDGKSYLFIHVVVTAKGPSDGMASFTVQTDTGSRFTTATNMTSRRIKLKDLTKNSRHLIPLPDSSEQYLRLAVGMDGRESTVTLSAWLMPSGTGGCDGHS